jgi:hypothetical protein
MAASEHGREAPELFLYKNDYARREAPRYSNKKQGPQREALWHSNKKLDTRREAAMRRNKKLTLVTTLDVQKRNSSLQALPVTRPKQIIANLRTQGNFFKERLQL